MTWHRMLVGVVGGGVIAATVVLLARGGGGSSRAARPAAAAAQVAERGGGTPGAWQRDRPAAPARSRSAAGGRHPAARAGSAAATDASAEYREAAAQATTLGGAAEAENTPEAWDAVAAAQAQALAACGAGPSCMEHAYAEALARVAAMHAEGLDPPGEGEGPVPLPPRVAAMVDAFDRFAEQSPDAPDAPGARFLAARELWRYRQHADAVPRLAALALAPEPVEVTEYAINLLLDTLMRGGRRDELRAWIDRLLADEARLADFPDLLARLRALRAAP